jgi:hypothetical protein
LAFTKALYYPWIDIKDEGWLKNAMLYWDKIHTIVPRSFESPYKKRAASISSSVIEKVIGNILVSNQL